MDTSVLIHYMQRLVSDDRIKPVHLLLSFAICDHWAHNQFQPVCQISRGLLMKSSRIRSTATYHKAIKDLQAFGYVRYYPSNHPTQASRIELLNSEINP